MRNRLFRKGLAIGIIVLLVGIAIAPSITANVKQTSTANCLTADTKIDTLTISNHDFAVIDKHFEDLWIKFYEADNIKEKIEVIKEIIVRVDTYGLLPDGTTLEEAQELVVTNFLLAEKSATNSKEISLSNNDDIVVYIFAGWRPTVYPHPDDPGAPSIGFTSCIWIDNYRSEPIEWFGQRIFYSIPSGSQYYRWPPRDWEYRGSIEPNDHDFFTSGFFTLGPKRINVNVMIEDMIISRWGFLLGYGLKYFPRIGIRDNNIPLTISTINPNVIKSNRISQEEIVIDNDYVSAGFNKHLFPEYPTKEQVFQFNNLDYISEISKDSKLTNKNFVVEKQKKEPRQTIAADAPVASPWPMYCHDNRHTGRSQYSTAHIDGFEKWRHRIVGVVTMSPSIDTDGTIYLAGSCLYAFYPNGTIKWKFDPPGGVFDFMCPAIDENGTIYASTLSNKYKYMYAINPDGTVKWKKSVGSVYSPPTIDNNGMIYFAQSVSDKSYITALNPDGTTEWKSYTSEERIYSSPAIGMDGTIYCGSHDYNLYAFNSDGTLKWKFNTGGRGHGSPAIGSDGTIFIGSENGLHALYPNNGSMKWHSHIGAVWGALAIDLDDTLYVCDSSGKFYAINPDGTTRWTYNAPYRVWFTSPALSADGIIFFGTRCDYRGGVKGKIIALNADGTERWNWTNSYYDYENFQSAPAIGADGTVYIASSHWVSGGPWYLHAFGVLDPNAPNAPTISGPTNGKPWEEYEYIFKSIDPNGDNIYYYIDWGDGSEEAWIGPYGSGEEVKVAHTWAGPVSYTICAKAKDTDDFFGPWGTLEVTMPRNKISTYNSLFLRFLDQFPILQKILLQRLGLQ